MSAQCYELLRIAAKPYLTRTAQAMGVTDYGTPEMWPKGVVLPLKQTDLMREERA
jgi:hypothetical protein